MFYWLFYSGLASQTTSSLSNRIAVCRQKKKERSSGSLINKENICENDHFMKVNMNCGTKRNVKVIFFRDIYLVFLSNSEIVSFKKTIIFVGYII